MGLTLSESETTHGRQALVSDTLTLSPSSWDVNGILPKSSNWILMCTDDHGKPTSKTWVQEHSPYLRIPATGLQRHTASHNAVNSTSQLRNEHRKEECKPRASTSKTLSHIQSRSIGLNRLKSTDFSGSQSDLIKYSPVFTWSKDWTILPCLDISFKLRPIPL